MLFASDLRIKLKSKVNLNGFNQSLDGQVLVWESLEVPGDLCYKPSKNS